MSTCIVTAAKLNKRSAVPPSLSDKTGIIGVVNKGFTFQATEVSGVTDPALGTWYKDRDNYFYWGGALSVVDDEPEEEHAQISDNTIIPPSVKRKIEQVINVFETGSVQGNYAAIAKFADYTDPATNQKIVQVTYGRSQTTEFGNLKALIQEYIASNGLFAAQFEPYADRIGTKPSLATDEVFCKALVNAGKNDPIMRTCQDTFFDNRYYLPAHTWFSVNGFTLPLSLLVIYDSYIHSGSIPSFLRKRFNTAVPSSGGNEKDWITAYTDARYNWLANHSDPLLQKTAYRPKCFKEQIAHNNWDLSQPIDAHGVMIS